MYFFIQIDLMVKKNGISLLQKVWAFENLHFLPTANIFIIIIMPHI